MLSKISVESQLNLLFVHLTAVLGIVQQLEVNCGRKREMSATVVALKSQRGSQHEAQPGLRPPREAERERETEGQKGDRLSESGEIKDPGENSSSQLS